MTTQAEMITTVEQELKGLSEYLETVDYTNAATDAANDTGWAFPVSAGFQTYWQKQRLKRHLYEYLRSESAHKYKVKVFSLNQRFEHYMELIKEMDQKFADIQESEPQEFASVDSYKLFGTNVNAGFQYDGVGNDTTYDSDNQVNFDPGENA